MNSHSPRALLTELWEIIKRPIAYFVFDNFVKADPKNFTNLMEQYLKNSLHIKAVVQEVPNVLEDRNLFAEKIDIQNLMRLIKMGGSEIFTDYPSSVFDSASLLFNARNEWAHQKELSSSDVEDIFDGSKKLLKLIGTNSAKKASKRIRQLLRHDYFRHIPLPQNHIPQHDLLEQIKQDISSNNASIIALHGMGGIGKTVLARSLCEDKEIQDRFPDGILWMSFGENLGEFELRKKLGEWLHAFGSIGDGIQLSLDSMRTQIAEHLKHRSCLLILDDVWKKSDVHAFGLGGKQCCTIITSRDAEIMRDFGAKIIPIPVMPETTAIALLEKWSNGALSTAEKKLKRKIVHRLGYLPLALKLAGAQLQKQNPLTWLEKFDARKLESKRPEALHDSLEQTFNLSLSLLSAESQFLFATLGIFKETTKIPQTVVSHFWQSLEQIDFETSEELLRDFAACALCELAEEEDSFAVVLHPLIRDFVKHKLSNSKELHQRFLASYETSQKGLGWQAVLDAAYFYQHFSYHLQKAEKLSLLSEFLFDFSFLQAKLDVSNIDELIMDFDLLPDNPAARIVQSVLLMSSYILSTQPDELATQLYLMLKDDEDYPEIKLLRQTAYESPIPRLIPSPSNHRKLRGVRIYIDETGQARIWQYQTGEELSEREESSLIQNTNLLRKFISSGAYSSLIQKSYQEQGLENSPSRDSDITLVPGTAYNFEYRFGHDIYHQKPILFIEIWEQYLVSASADTLVLWDWKTETIVKTQAVDMPASNTIHLTDTLVATLLEDSLCIKHLPTEEILKCSRGLSEQLKSIALSEDLEILISDDSYLKLRNPQTAQEISPSDGQDYGFNMISVYKDIVVSITSDMMLMLWNWRTGEVITQQYSQNSQTAIAIIEHPFTVILGDETGEIHFLKPNPALLKALAMHD